MVKWQGETRMMFKGLNPSLECLVFCKYDSMPVSGMIFFKCLQIVSGIEKGLNLDCMVRMGSIEKHCKMSDWL